MFLLKPSNTLIHDWPRWSDMAEVVAAVDAMEEVASVAVEAEAVEVAVVGIKLLVKSMDLIGRY